MNVAALWVAQALVRGFDIDSVGALVFGAIIFGIVNALIRPVVLLLTCPVQLLTLGLSALIVNALLFWLAASLVPGVHVSGFIGAFLAAIVVSLVSWIVSMVARS